MALFDVIGAFLGFVFTLIVFSYLIGDNPFFRFTLHLFIGVSAGFSAVIAIYNIIWPRLIEPFFSNNSAEQVLALIPIILGALLLTKISPRLAFIGNLPVAYLVGVSAAAAIGGAVTGTLYPQVSASINLFDWQSNQAFDLALGLRLINGVIILIGTIATLAYFHFGTSAPFNEKLKIQSWIGGLGQVGQVFIAITFGFLFAGIYSAALTALIERIYFLVDTLKSLLDIFTT
jgi:hypothetical protein